MQNTTLAIAIPTFNRAETVHENLLSLIPEIKEYSIPIYISDGKENDIYETHFIRDLLPHPFG